MDIVGDVVDADMGMAAFAAVEEEMDNTKKVRPKTMPQGPLALPLVYVDQTVD
jgi:hypothetical protein